MSYKFQIGDLLEKKWEQNFRAGLPDNLLVVNMTFDIKYIIMDVRTGNIMHCDTQPLENLYRQVA